MTGNGDDTRQLIEMHAATVATKPQYMRSLREFITTEAKGEPHDATEALRRVHESACEYFNAYESLAGYTKSLAPSDSWRHMLANDCCEVLSSRARHQAFLVNACARLHLSDAEFRPSPSAYQEMQRLVAAELPGRVVELKNLLTNAGLPAAGFDMPTDNQQDSAWKAFREAVSKLPGGKWVYAPVALGAAGAIVLGLYLGSIRLAIWGSVFSFTALILYFIFAQGARSKVKLTKEFKLITYVVAGLFSVLLVTMYLCVFWGKPLDLRYWISTQSEAMVAKYDIFDADGHKANWIAADNAVVVEAPDLDRAPRLLVSQNTVIVTFLSRTPATLVLIDQPAHKAYRRKIEAFQGRSILRVPKDFEVGAP